MGISAIVFMILKAAGVALRPDTQSLIERSLKRVGTLVDGIIKHRKEPSPEQVAAMDARLIAGEDRWDDILDDWV